MSEIQENAQQRYRKTVKGQVSRAKSMRKYYLAQKSILKSNEEEVLDHIKVYMAQQLLEARGALSDEDIKNKEKFKSTRHIPATRLWKAFCEEYVGKPPTRIRYMTLLPNWPTVEQYRCDGKTIPRPAYIVDLLDYHL